MKKKFIPIAAFFITLTSFGCSHEGSGFLDKFLKGGGSTVPVTVENVLVRDRSYKIKVPAVLKPSEEVKVTMPDEVTIKRVFIAKGDAVEAGDTLFQISEKTNTSILKKYREELKDARTEVEKNSYLYNNRDRLLEEGRIDQNQYDNLEMELDTNEAKIEKLQAEISRLGEQTGDISITSPIGGIVSDVTARAGMAYSANNPLATITKVDPILAVFELESYESSTVRPGMIIDVRLSDLSGKNLRGEITKVDTTLDPENKTFKTYATVPNTKGYLKVGMSAEIEFMSRKKQRFYLIPAEALIREHRRYFVFTVINGVAHKVEVVPKEKRGNRIEIAKGLRKDDLIVVKGNDKLTEGAVVDIWGR